MKISPNLYGRMDGSKFWCFPGFPENSLLYVILRYTVYIQQIINNVDNITIHFGFRLRNFMSLVSTIKAFTFFNISQSCCTFLWSLKKTLDDSWIVLNYSAWPNPVYITIWIWEDFERQSTNIWDPLLVNAPTLHVLCELCCTLLVLHVLIRVALPLTLQRSLPVNLFVHCSYLAVYSVSFGLVFLEMLWSIVSILFFIVILWYPIKQPQN